MMKRNKNRVYILRTKRNSFQDPCVLCNSQKDRLLTERWYLAQNRREKNEAHNADTARLQSQPVPFALRSSPALFRLSIYKSVYA